MTTDNNDTAPTTERTCFVLMPIGTKGTEDHRRNSMIYEKMIKPVLVDCGYNPKRADELNYPGNIMADIIRSLAKADLVVADLSGQNPNVHYELGVRHALFPHGTIPIINKEHQLPFDVSQYRAIFYSTDLEGADDFRHLLREKIAAFENKKKEDRSDNPVHDVLGDEIHELFEADSVHGHSLFLKNILAPGALVCHRMDGGEEIYKKAIALISTAKEEVRTTSFGSENKDETIKYLNALAEKARLRKNVKKKRFLHKVIYGPDQLEDAANRIRIFESHKAQSCLQVGSATHNWGVDFLIVDKTHMHISFQGVEPYLYMGLEFVDLPEIVVPAVDWFDDLYNSPRINRLYPKETV